jgi:predicted 3-demethylubiquinone-9 3-methyltransferase (glyoxalase superfamily)
MHSDGSRPAYADRLQQRLDADASTKYAALSSLGNVPVVYMTAVNGWVHDRFGTGWVLQTDAVSATLFVVVALFVLHKINAAPPARAQSLAADKSRVG